jgi:hypothetical protein
MVTMAIWVEEIWEATTWVTWVEISETVQLH